MQEANIPIAEKAAQRKMAPMYPPIIGPASGVPNMYAVRTYDKVGTSIATLAAKAAMNFPAATSKSVTGSVINVSRLPLRFSSLKSRIVRAGTKKLSKVGNIPKKFLSSARFARKKVEKKINPEKIRKSPVTM